MHNVIALQLVKDYLVKFGVVVDFLINEELLLPVRSACGSYNAYLVTKKEVEMKEKKERAKRALEEKYEQGRTTELDQLKSNLQLKQNDC